MSADVLAQAAIPDEAAMAREGYAYWHIDAFAERPFTGNQAAVIVLPAWLPDATLQAIAAENNFAETAFVVADESETADWELRWFTPVGEIRLCGHATLASGHALLGRDKGNELLFRTREAGLLTVRRMAEAGYEVALPAIEVVPQTAPEWVAFFGLAPRSVSRNPLGYNLLHYENSAQVRALQPDFGGVAALGDDQYICTARSQDTDIVSRVFVPGAGIDEDSVTGSAHAVLTPYWAAILGRSGFTAYQASPRGGTLSCRLEGDRVWLGGHCVTVAEGRYFVCG